MVSLTIMFFGAERGRRVGEGQLGCLFVFA